MEEFSENTARKTAQLFCETWNTLAKNADWPQRIEVSEVLRNKKVLTGCMKGLELCKEGKRSPSTLLRWILSNWNWRKSPAPMNLVTSSSQWENLKASIRREAEELGEEFEARLERVRIWTRKEIDRNSKKGRTFSQAAKETEIYAKASGRTLGWTKEELDCFKQEIEKKE